MYVQLNASSDVGVGIDAAVATATATAAATTAAAAATALSNTYIDKSISGEKTGGVSCNVCLR